VGAGMAANIKGDKIGIVCTFSDGSTSEGAFHEAMNFAGVFKTPNVFVCYNNQYAISFPREKQTASKTIAQKAVAYGFHGVLVDGNDVFSVYTAVNEALENARKGKGPTLIEAFTYRMGAHTTSDDSLKYRSADEIKAWEKKDPIERLSKYLQNKGIWSAAIEKDVQMEVSAFIDKAVQEAENTPAPSLDDIFIYTYKNLPPHLKEQLENMRILIKDKET
jgi:pyruvate dehydrogenase E1 component alpha subunit